MNRMGDSYRPSDSTRRQDDRFRRDRHDRPGQSRHGGQYGRDRRDGRNARGGRGGRPGFFKKAAERPFLVTNRAPTPELLPGMDETEDHAPKFKPLEDLDGGDSELDGDEQEGEDAAGDNEDDQPKKKQARTSASTGADGNSVPKWSNPDPYTALPPPDESLVKKKDVVKLIRKARLESQKEAARPVAEADDFISFNFDEDKESEQDEDDMSISSGATARDSRQADGANAQSQSFSHRTEVIGPRPPPAMNGRTDFTPLNKPVLDTSSDPDLGNRKRTYDDRIKGPSMVPKPTPKYPAKGSITREWKAVPEYDSTPWVRDHSKTVNMADW